MSGELPAVDLRAASRFVAASGFEVTEAGGARVTGHVDLGPDQHTPWGVVHGGVYCTVIESAASIGASAAVLDTGQFAVGVNNQTDFLAADDQRSARRARRTGPAGPDPAAVAGHADPRGRRQDSGPRAGPAAERPAAVGVTAAHDDGAEDGRTHDGRTHDGLVRAAAAAAVEVAAAHGVRATEPRVLHDGANVVVHLAPAPLVARVATLTRLLRDGVTSFGREVRLARELAAAGAPVVPPADLLPPGPHVHDGTVLSFWPYVAVLPEQPTPRQVAAAWAELRERLDALPAEGRPLDAPLDDLAAFLDRASAWGVPDDVVSTMAARLDLLRQRLDGDLRRLHGDSHPGNLLATRSGLRWADFEDSCSGPPQWDLVAPAHHPPAGRSCGARRHPGRAERRRAAAVAGAAAAARRRLVRGHRPAATPSGRPRPAPGWPRSGRIG